MAKDPSCGSELNRLSEFGDYDEVQFNKLYKLIVPYVKRLSRNIDHRRLNVTPDLVESYFIDKFLYIYSKYHKRYEYEQLKANILKGLKLYSYRLMKEGYTRRSEFNQSLVSFENLFDDSKEDFIDVKGSNFNIFSDILSEYMEKHLTQDEFLIWKLMLDPTQFLVTRMNKSGGKISISHLIDFFEFPRIRSSYNYFSSILQKIKNLQEEAKVKLN